MEKIAERAGQKQDVAKYRKLFADAKQAFADRYLVGGKLPEIMSPPSGVRAAMDGADAISRGNLESCRLRRGQIESF